MFSGISDSLVRWRRVLKRQRSILVTDMIPDLLTSRLADILPPQMCKIFEHASGVQQHMDNAKTLVLFLLERDQEDWPTDLLAGLRETDQSPLAQTLEEEYYKILKEEEAAKTNRRDRRLDVTRVKYKQEVSSNYFFTHASVCVHQPHFCMRFS